MPRAHVDVARTECTRGRTLSNRAPAQAASSHCRRFKRTGSLVHRRFKRAGSLTLGTKSKVHPGRSRPGGSASFRTLNPTVTATQAGWGVGCASRGGPGGGAPAGRSL
eukprot:11016833-Alexandrium_andersonii.AAC.1